MTKLILNFKSKGSKKIKNLKNYLGSKGANLAVMGKHGLRAVAEQCLKKAHYTYQQLCNIPGVAPAFPHSFFKEFVVKLPCSPATVNQELLHAGIIGGLDLGSYDPALTNHMLISVTEKATSGWTPKSRDI